MIDIPISTKTFCGGCGWCNRVIWKVDLIRVIKWSLVQVIVVSKFKFCSWLIGDFNQHSSFVTSVQTNYVHHPCHIRSILSRTHAKYGHVQFLFSLKDEMRFFSLYYQAKARIFLICNQWGGICDAELFYKSINDRIFYLLSDLVHYLSWLRYVCHLLPSGCNRNLWVTDSSLWLLCAFGLPGWFVLSWGRACAIILCWYYWTLQTYYVPSTVVISP